MPGRIEGYEPVLMSATVLPIWKTKLWAILKGKKK